MQGIVGFLRHVQADLQPLLDLADVAAARQQVLEEQLVLGDPLHRFDEVGGDGVLQIVLALQGLEEGAAVRHQQRGGVRLVGAVLDVGVEAGRPSHEAMAHVFRHRLVLFQLLQENVLVKAQNLLQVAEDDGLLALQGPRHHLPAVAQHGLDEAPDYRFQVRHVGALRLQQLGHDELFAPRGPPLLLVQLLDLLQVSRRLVGVRVLGELGLEAGVRVAVQREGSRRRLLLNAQRFLQLEPVFVHPRGEVLVGGVDLFHPRLDGRRVDVAGLDQRVCQL